MSLACPKCKREVFEEAIFCPYCGTRIKGVPLKRSVLPTVGGVLTIVAGGFSLLVGLLGMVAFSLPPANLLPKERYTYVFMGVFGLAAFTLGLASAILTLKREHFGISIGGMFLLVFSGAFYIFASLTIAGFGLANGLILAVPIILLAFLSLVFTVMSEEEFV